MVKRLSTTMLANTIIRPSMINVVGDGELTDRKKPASIAQMAKLHAKPNLPTLVIFKFRFYIFNAVHANYY